MATVICSHGFGVKADSRGMFPEIAAACPDWAFKLFDYNDVRANGDTVVASLHQQAKKLQQAIDDTDTDDVVLLAHSQGCIVAGLVDIEKVSKVILLAPPVEGSMKAVIAMMARKPGAVYDPDGQSILPRADGTTTYLKKEYFESLEKLQPMALYQDIAARKPTLIVRALQDEILGLTDANSVSGATHVDVMADHNFTGDSRARMIDVVRDFIQIEG